LRVAVIDIGTNSTRLLIADVVNEKVEVLHTGLTTTRLGEGIGGGYLLSKAVERTIAVLKKYRQAAQAWQAARIAAVATSAVRGAQNRNDFLKAVREETGLQVKVLSGEEEAYYGYQGVISGLPVDPQEVAVMDVGGGSTEFTWQRNGRLFFRSVDAGAVRATEGRYTEGQIRRLVKPVVEEIRQISPGLLVGVGGTVTTLAAMAMGLRVYDPALVHGYLLQREQVAGLFSLLAGTPLEKRRQLPGLQPERADIIIAGVQIVLIVLTDLGLGSILVSEADIMHGIALKLSK